MSRNQKPNIHIGMIGKPSKVSMSLAALSSLAAMPCSPFLIVEARVRYWEDATVNGVDDSEEGELIPLKDGEYWKLIIDLKTGKIQNWPEGITADIHYKVCDQGEYWLGDADGTKRMKWKGNYVPDKFLCHGDEGWGDYIIFCVTGHGQIVSWSYPVIDFAQWESLENETNPAAGSTLKENE